MKWLALGAASLIGIFVETAISQEPPDASFGVASVKRDIQFTRPAQREDERGVKYTYISLGRVLMNAYRIQQYQLAGPSWLNSEYYDIEAKAPEGATVSQIPGMLRQLLNERFGAAVHWESREIGGYTLQLDKTGPKLKECKLDECPREGLLVQAGGGAGFLRFQARTTGKLADQLAGVLKEPVIDMTGLSGTWSIHLNTHKLDADANQTGTADRITIGGQTIDIPESTPSVFDALKEVGLRVVHQRLTIRSLVVDHIERSPTEN
jgi:uncharacterized protein (TIGR03435 family)